MSRKKNTRSRTTVNLRADLLAKLERAPADVRERSGASVSRDRFLEEVIARADIPAIIEYFVEEFTDTKEVITEEAIVI